MIGLLIAAIVLIAIAWLAWTYLPHPLGVIIAVICGVILLIYLLSALSGTEGVDADATLLGPLALFSRYRVRIRRAWRVLRGKPVYEVQLGRDFGITSHDSSSSSYRLSPLP